MKNLAIILSTGIFEKMKSYVKQKIVPSFDILNQSIIEYVSETLSNDFEKYFLVSEVNIPSLLKDQKNILKKEDHELDLKLKRMISNYDNVLFIYANMPLISKDSIQMMFKKIQDYNGVYNQGICLFKCDFIMSYLKEFSDDLKSFILKVKEDGNHVEFVTLPKDDLLFVNDRISFAKAFEIMQQRINESHMLNGISILDPKTTYISKKVKIGNDTTIYPNTYIFGSSIIGTDCEIGPNAFIEDSLIDNHTNVLNCVIKHQSIQKK